MSLYRELSRRNVLRVAIAYLTTAWLLLQVASIVFPVYGLGNRALYILITVMAIGFPLSLLFSWAFEFTPEGLKREHELDQSRTVTADSGKKLDRIIIVSLSLALGLFAIDKFLLEPARDAQRVEKATSLARKEALGSFFGDKSIAVLPFDNRSALQEDVFFVDGVHDDLLTLLSKLGGMKVISRSSVEKFRGKVTSIPDVAAQLGVATVLEGAVQRAGDQVRITVQLIDAATDNHLWAESYDRELTARSVFSIQSDIAQTIAKSLKTVLTADEQIRLTTVPTANFTAYEEYLRGLQRLTFREIPDLQKAVSHFRRSIELDPGYAIAYAALAEAYQLLHYYGHASVSETVPLMRVALRSALELDPGLGEAHASLGAMFRYQGRWDKALAAYERAIELAPGQATIYHQFAEFLRTGFSDPGRALPLIRKARDLDPLSPVINITLSETLMHIGLHDEALLQIDRTIEAVPDYPSAYLVRSQVLAYSFGKLGQALTVRKYAVSLDPESVLGHIGLAQLYSELGDDGHAIDHAGRGLTLGPDYVWAHHAATEVFLAAGDFGQALIHARRVNSMRPGNPLALRTMRDADLKRGAITESRLRYENIFPQFKEPAILRVSQNDFGAAIDYAYLLMHDGQQDRARQILLTVLEFLPSVNRLGFRGMGIDDVRVLVMLGEKERALETLDQAVAQGWRRGWRVALGLSSLDAIRNDPRFVTQQAILEQSTASQLASANNAP